MQNVESNPEPEVNPEILDPKSNEKLELGPEDFIVSESENEDEENAEDEEEELSEHDSSASKVLSEHDSDVEFLSDPNPNAPVQPTGFQFVSSMYQLDSPIDALANLQGYYNKDLLTVGVAEKDVPEAFCAMDVISDHLHTAPVPPRWNYPNTEGFPIQGMRIWETLRKEQDVTDRLAYYNRHTTSSAAALHYLELMTDQFNRRAIYPGNRKGARMFTPTSEEYRAMAPHHFLDEYLNAK